MSRPARKTQSDASKLVVLIALANPNINGKNNFWVMGVGSGSLASRRCLKKIFSRNSYLDNSSYAVWAAESQSVLGFGRRRLIRKIFAPKTAQTRLAIISLIRISAANILRTEHWRPKPSQIGTQLLKLHIMCYLNMNFRKKLFFGHLRRAKEPHPTPVT